MAANYSRQKALKNAQNSKFRQKLSDQLCKNASDKQIDRTIAFGMFNLVGNDVKFVQIGPETTELWGGIQQSCQIAIRDLGT